MDIVYFLSGFIIGGLGVLLTARCILRFKYRQILNVIHINRHRHPAHILDRVQKYIAFLQRRTF